jgi:hypothetical protein
VSDLDFHLVPLCRATLEVSEILVVPAPLGAMTIGEIRTSRWEGERFKATQRGRASADWLRSSPDGGFGSVDVRSTLETDDGALVFVSYYGRFDPATGRIYSAPRFETGDERYRWMNGVLAAARGQFDPAALTVTYEVCEMV